MKHSNLRKVMAGMFVLCLCFYGCIGTAEEKPQSAAWTLDFSTVPTPYESIMSLCWVGDTLYILIDIKDLREESKCGNTGC